VKQRQSDVKSHLTKTVSYAAEFNQAFDMKDSLQKWQKLTHLSEDFLDHSKRFGRIIITEQHLPDAEKTIHKFKIGGVAGGDKYLHKGILFKLTVDTCFGPNRYLYGGRQEGYEFAAKAAGHGLRAGQKYIEALSTRNHRLRIPMEVIVEFRGCRLTAQVCLVILYDVSE
jgi:hypothetical protein